MYFLSWKCFFPHRSSTIFFFNRWHFFSTLLIKKKKNEIFLKKNKSFFLFQTWKMKSLEMFYFPHIISTICFLKTFPTYKKKFSRTFFSPENHFFSPQVISTKRHFFRDFFFSCVKPNEKNKTFSWVKKSSGECFLFCLNVSKVFFMKSSME